MMGSDVSRIRMQVVVRGVLPFYLVEGMSEQLTRLSLGSSVESGEELRAFQPLAGGSGRGSLLSSLNTRVTQ